MHAFKGLLVIIIHLSKIIMCIIITKMHEIIVRMFDEAKQNTFKNSPVFGMPLAVCKDFFVFLPFSVKYRIFACD